MKHPVVAAAIGVLFFGALAAAGIFYATQPAWFARPGPNAGATVGSGPSSAGAVAAPPAVLVPAPQEAPKPSPITPLPAPDWYKPGDPPVIEAAPAPKLPKKADDRQQLELEVRRQKFASSMDALNRRSAARLGLPPPIPPSAPPAPAAYNSRRGVVSSAEPARRAEPSQ